MRRFIFLDLDNTLFDSFRFRTALFKEIGLQLGDTNEKKEIYNLCEKIHAEFIKRRGMFEPESFLDEVLKKKKERKEILDIIFHKIHYETYIFDDVVTGIKDLSKLGEVGIFSHGESKFQRTKLESIIHLFKSEHIHITTGKKLYMKKLFKNHKDWKVFYVDDMLPMLAHAKFTDSSVITLWMHRIGNSQKWQGSNFTPDVIVRNLEEVVKYIKKS